MRHEIQNPMVIDSNWEGVQKYIGICKVCGWEIYEEEGYMEVEGGIIHHEIYCLSEFESEDG